MSDIDFTIKINNTEGRTEELQGFTAFEVVDAIDAACKPFAFSLPYEDNEKNRKRFRPYSSGVLSVHAGGEMILSGYYENPEFSLNANTRVLELQGRSASGAIIEWSAGSQWERVVKDGKLVNIKPLPNLAFEATGLKLQDILKQFAAAHMINAIPGTEVIPEITIEPGQTVFDFISKLMATNGYFGVPLPDGSLYYFKSIGKAAFFDDLKKTEYYRNRDITKSYPVCDLIEGVSPIISANTSHDVTKRFWKYMVVTTAWGEPNVEYMAIDKKLSPAIRGIKIIQPSQQSADYSRAAAIERSRALIDSYTVSIQVKGYGYLNADRRAVPWAAGDVVRVKIPSVFILKPTLLIIKRAVFKRDNDGDYTTLDLGFKEAYSGGYPEAFPWED